MGKNDFLSSTHASSNLNARSSGHSRSFEQLFDDTPVASKLLPLYTETGWMAHKSPNVVRDDLGPCIQELSYDFFKKNILPPLRKKVNVKGTISRLKNAGFIKDTNDGSRWTAFPDDPYKENKAVEHDSTKAFAKAVENEVFAKLATVVNAIFDSSGTPKRRGSTVVYESLPDSIPLCCIGEKHGSPDGYLLFKNRFLPDREDGRRYWRDIATPAEFKLQDTRDDLQYDVNKICWSMSRIMQEDPRRRFVLAFTIENTQMRVWMANRTEVLVSQPFNFIKASRLFHSRLFYLLTCLYPLQDHEKFVHFFLSQAYAHEHELGIDTTMTKVSAEPGKVPMYDIIVRVVQKVGGRKKVQNQTFRTEKLISDDGAKDLRGKGTRVWKVHRVVGKVVDFSKPGVLKDAWVDEDGEREGDILEEIRNQKGLSEISEKFLKSVLLTPIARGDVYIGNTRDGTRTLITRGAEVPEDATKFPLHIPPTHQPSHSKSTLDVNGGDNISEYYDMIQAGKIVRYFSKSHYRIVIEEECKPLSNVESLHTVFRALHQVTIGLMIMHRRGTGWVHRDISVGNILIDLNGGGTKLSDLEYARRLDVSTPRETRTGTANFMSVEVDNQCYLYGCRPVTPEPEEPTDFNMDRYIEAVLGLAKWEDLAPSRKKPSAPRPAPRPVFRYNPMHDLESVWWVAVYFVVNKQTSLAATRSSSNDSAFVADSHVNLTVDQRIYASSLFYDPSERLIAMSGSDTLDRHLRSLPSYLSEVGEALITLRKSLRGRYNYIESSDREDDQMVCGVLYEVFADAFSTLAASLKREDITVTPLCSRPPKQDGLRIDAARASTPVAPKTSNTKRKLEGKADTRTRSKRQKTHVEADPQAKATVPKSKKTKGRARNLKKKGN
ncbi:hypothetical protein BC835DRAFT_768834 [Cytidiella melzeri]|nr:hypothetical protein BC835DRAFT_768834 [Cytidiella melzeri]